jgi:hypothetical protein
MDDEAKPAEPAAPEPAGEAQPEAAEAAAPQPPKKARGGAVFGFGILLILIALALLGYQYLKKPRLGEHVEVGPKEKVYYKDGATEEQAEKLGQILVKVGIFDGKGGGKSVVIARTDGLYTVTFILAEGTWDNEQLAKGFRRLLEPLSVDVFEGRPVAVHLCDSHLKVKKVIE